jgi:hypothetical protein
MGAARADVNIAIDAAPVAAPKPATFFKARRRLRSIVSSSTISSLCSGSIFSDIKVPNFNHKNLLTMYYKLRSPLSGIGKISKVNYFTFDFTSAPF